jgi:predicted MFS family arabinose efflux permease
LLGFSAALGADGRVTENRWLILFVLFLARTAMALQFQTVASAGPFLIDALAIDFAALGLLIGLYMLPGVVIALPGGMLGQRFGAKRVVLVGLVLMAIGGALMGLGSSFAMAAAGRIVSGTGAVLLTVLISKMVTDWFAGREIVTAMSIVIVSWPFGLAVGLMTYGALATASGWRAVMYVGVLAAIAAFALIALIYRDPPDIAGAASSGFRVGLARREWLLILISGSIWGLFNVAYIVLISFAPDLFTARGYSLAEASSIVSIIGWVLIPLIPFTGLLVERVGRPSAFMAGGFLVAAAATSALPFMNAPLIAFWILAIAIAVPAGLIMALPAQVLRPESRGGGMGVFFTCYFVAMATLPAAAGLARDLSGSAAAPALFAAAMTLLCAVGLMLFHAAKQGKQ